MRLDASGVRTMVCSIKDPAQTRRRFLKQSLMLTAGGAFASAFPHAAHASFPDSPIKVIVPTQAGGGAERNLKAISSVWSKRLGTTFEPAFYPGASGRIGYEVFMKRYAPDAHHLLFGNMGPEVLNWSVQSPSFDIDDMLYFGRVDTDPAALFVSADSPYHTIDDVVAEAKRRQLTVATSRLAHPASIGVLALGDHTGARFKLIPRSGGKNTVAAVTQGVTDIGTLTSGSILSNGDAVRVLMVFDDQNRLSGRGGNAPTMNGHFGTDLPPMLSSRAFGIHRQAAEMYPDRFEILQQTFRLCFDDPEFEQAYTAARGNWDYVTYGGVEECAAFKMQMLDLGERFRSFLTGS